MSRKKNAEAADLAAQIPGERLLQLRLRQTDGENVRMVAAELRVVEMDITQIMRVRALLLPHLEEIKAAADFASYASANVSIVAEALAVATGWPAPRIASLGGASFVQLAFAVVEVNADFFLLLPGLGAFASPAKTGRANGAGEQLSRTSESTGTSSVLNQ